MQCLVGLKAGKGLLTGSSTYYNKAHYAFNKARLDGPEKSGWCPDYYKATEHFVQVDLHDSQRITGIVTQGYGKTSGFWVTAFKVMVGPQTHRMQYVTDAAGNNKVFIGNSNGIHHAVNYFYSSCNNVRFVRVIPVSWYKSPVLKFDLLKC